jgi:uncharacterized protein with FMN-binding domain
VSRSPRRTRLRRASALGLMLFVVGALVALRGALTPPAPAALAHNDLARVVGGQASAPSPSPSRAGRPRARSRRHGIGHSHPSSHPSSHPKAPRMVTVTGNPFDVGYGVVQVRVTLRGHRIVDVSALSLPSGGRSSDISAYAAPQLRREALARQSARIDTVSGASYTSAGYARSLQSALDRSGA